MRIRYLQHVPFEGLASMESFFLNGGHRIAATRLYLGEALPTLADFDWLVVLGGPMGVYDTDRYPWLVPEQALIKQAITAGKRVLGVCLGAQLMAAALGARVFANPDKEIGWWPVHFLETASGFLPELVLPARETVFHWHGDTFDLPPGATLLASSAACANQAFALSGSVLGLQFHLETSPDSAAALIDQCAGDLDGSRYVQCASDMLDNTARFDAINRLMFTVLGAMEQAGESAGIAP